MKKVVALVHQAFEELELLYPVIRMREEGIEVALAGVEKGARYVGKNGYPCQSDLSFQGLNGAAFDGVLIPGGYAPDRLRIIPEVIDFIRDMDHQKKMIACICHGGWVPISAKIVQGRKATGALMIRDDLENAGAIWVDAPVVIDGHLISSRSSGIWKKPHRVFVINGL